MRARQRGGPGANCLNARPRDEALLEVVRRARRRCAAAACSRTLPPMRASGEHAPARVAPREEGSRVPNGPARLTKAPRAIAPHFLRGRKRTISKPSRIADYSTVKLWPTLVASFSAPAVSRAPTNPHPREDNAARSSAPARPGGTRTSRLARQTQLGQPEMSGAGAVARPWRERQRAERETLQRRARRETGARQGRREAGRLETGRRR